MIRNAEEKESIICSPLGISTEDGWAFIKWNISGMADGDFVLFHSVPESDGFLLGAETRGDAVLIAILLAAMQQGRDLHIDGDVSPTLMTGQERLQSIWERWGKGRYKRIRVSVARESGASMDADGGAIFCMSGGLDGAFSFFRHLKGEHRLMNRNPKGALMVHGFDIPLNRPVHFQNASENVEQMISGSGARLIRMRTNSRDLPQDWEESHGLQLTACLLTLQSAFRFGVIASGNPYDELNVWGSTPLTDPLGSTEAMTIEHDGAEFNRAQKAGWLGRNTSASDMLRVCWEGERGDRNCGYCEKCVRTMMNFWANGLPIPKSFPIELSREYLGRINISNGIHLREFRGSMVIAQKNVERNNGFLKKAERMLLRIEMRLALREAKRKTLAFIRGRL